MNKRTNRLINNIFEGANFNIKSDDEVLMELEKLSIKYKNSSNKDEIESEMKDAEESNNIRLSKKYLSDALLTQSDDNAIEYAKKAIELDPDNLEAEALLVEYEEELVNKLSKYNKLIDKVKEKLKELNIDLKKNIGFLWEFEESQLLLRLYYNKIYTLKSLGRYRDVIALSKEYLALDKEDRMEVKYMLEEAYCFVEEFEKCKEVYDEFLNKTPLSIFILSIMYFKKGEYESSIWYLNKLNDINPFIIKNLTKTLSSIIDDDVIQGENNVINSIYNPKEEADFTIREVLHLLASTPAFIVYLRNNFMEEE